MALIHDWLEGARIRTLPAAIAPVIAGAGIAFAAGAFSWLRTFLAAAVALTLQIGVNFANDYSDGIRGTDTFRAGPPRLTGGGKATPSTVRLAAFCAFGLAGVFGMILIALSGTWWLIFVGISAILAAWYYTGGKHPYGYAGLGELFVLIFFGYVATVGTVYTQTLSAPPLAWISGTGIGLIACALLMVNNIRDIPTDQLAGKHTLAVRLGQKWARRAYLLLLLLPLPLVAIGFYAQYPIFAALIAFTPWAARIARPVLRGATGKDLIASLSETGFYQLGYASAIACGIICSSYLNFPATIGWSIAFATLFIWGIKLFLAARKTL